jgi:hypothetical protein
MTGSGLFSTKFRLAAHSDLNDNLYVTLSTVHGNKRMPICSLDPRQQMIGRFTQKSALPAHCRQGALTCEQM